MQWASINEPGDVRLVAPEVSVNIHNIESVHVTSNTDTHAEPHVTINFKEFSTEISPEYSHAEIQAAIDGKCYYRSQWTDEVGEIDVCVLHGHNSQYSEWGPIGKQPFRLCLYRSPYYESYSKDRSLYWLPNRQPYSIEQGWEHREAKRKAEEQYEKDHPSKAELSPTAQVMSDPNFDLEVKPLPRIEYTTDPTFWQTIKSWLRGGPSDYERTL